MITRRTALIGTAFLTTASALVKTASAEEIMDTSNAAPVDLSALKRVKHKLEGNHSGPVGFCPSLHSV